MHLLRTLAGPIFTPQQEKSLNQALIVGLLISIIVCFSICYWVLPKLANYILWVSKEHNQKSMHKTLNAFRKIFLFVFISIAPYAYFELKLSKIPMLPIFIVGWVLIIVMYARNIKSKIK